MSVTMTPRTEAITLLQGKDESKLRELRTEAGRLRQEAERLRSDAEKKKPRSNVPTQVRLASEPDAYAEAKAAAEAADQTASEAEAEADKFAAAAEKRGVKVVMRSVGRKTWRRLMSDHPPRPDNEDDKQAGINTDTFGEAIVVACLASPVFGTEEERDEFLDSLNEGQFGRLELTAQALNVSIGADPKARLASSPAQT